MAAYVGFSSKGFEAHWAGLSSRCAKSPLPTFITRRKLSYLLERGQNFSKLFIKMDQ